MSEPTRKQRLEFERLQSEVAGLERLLAEVHPRLLEAKTASDLAHARAAEVAQELTLAWAATRPLARPFLWGLDLALGLFAIAAIAAAYLIPVIWFGRGY